MLLWAILLIAAAVGLYAIFVFNQLVRTRQMANEAWSGIDVQLNRRSELVPNLVESVKGYAAHERSVLEEVTRLRSTAREVPANDITGRAQAEGALSIALGKLLALAENYPDLKASTNFLECSSNWANSRPSSRWRAVTTMERCAIRMSWCSPSNLIAGAFGFAPRDYFELSDAAERAVPQVALSGQAR